MSLLGNLYRVFCYAWEHFPAGDAIDVGSDHCADLPNLLARMLVDGANRLIRSGLHREYVGAVEETRSPRGRLLLDEIIKTQTLRRGTVICLRDELTPDVLHNQIVKATARELSRARNVAPVNAHNLRLVVRRLGEVSDIRLTTGCFARLQLTRHAARYKPILRLCELVARNLLPDENGEGTRFAAILENETTMSQVFEAFLRSFFRLEQNVYKVEREHLTWPAAGADLDLAFLPRMETDLTLRGAGAAVVLDAKYYAEAFAWRHSQPKVHSGHLYQLMAYLRHTSAEASVDGGLIYPADGPGRTLSYEIHGHLVLVAAIDFRREWAAVKQELLSIAECFAERRGIGGGVSSHSVAS